MVPRLILRASIAFGILAVVARPARSQESPKYASMTTTRLLLLPAQEVTGTPEKVAWLTRFDSVLTARLQDGGIRDGWAYPKDAVYYARQNPTFLSDPHLMGTQALKAEKIKAGTPLMEPFGSRIRAFVAITQTRNAIVPVSARIDSTVTPRTARMQVALVDARLSSVLLTWTVETRFTGNVSVAADSLALVMARLFVTN